MIMYFASFEYEGKDHIGIKVDNDKLISLRDIAVALGDKWTARRIPSCMLDLIINQVKYLKLLKNIEAILPDLNITKYSQDEVKWHPPVKKPGKIVGVAMNNSASNARKISAPDHPMFFTKPSSCLIGHNQDIEVRPYYGGLHPEPELAVVIGKKCRNLDPNTALDYVFGYTIMNDITGNVMRSEDMVHYYALYASKDNPEELEKREQHLSYAARYKGTDGFGPIGPWLVTKDEIPDNSALDVTCSVNGDVVAEDSTQYLNYKVVEILAFLSRFQTLEPGDIVSMGTAFRSKPGVKRSIHTADLQKFDGPVEVTITGLGTLSNGVKRIDDKIDGWKL